MTVPMLFENSTIQDTEENRQLIIPSYGRIYVLKDITHDRIKVGFTRKAVADRINKIANACVTTDYDYYVSGVVLKPKDLERTIHEKLRPFRIHGEWFNISFIEAIEVLKKECQKLQIVTADYLLDNKLIQDKRTQQHLETLKNIAEGNYTLFAYTEKEHEHAYDEKVTCVSVPFSRDKDNVCMSLRVCRYNGREYCCLPDLFYILQEKLEDILLKDYLKVCGNTTLIPMYYNRSTQKIPFVEYSVIDEVLTEGVFCSRNNKHISHWVTNNVGSAFEYLKYHYGQE